MRFAGFVRNKPLSHNGLPLQLELTTCNEISSPVIVSYFPVPNFGSFFAIRTRMRVPYNASRPSSPVVVGIMIGALTEIIDNLPAF